jgi:signal transduction histidine kinase
LSIVDLRPESERVKALHLARSLEGKKDIRFKGLVKHKKKNGDVIDVEVTSHAFECKGSLHIVVVANDVTEKLQAEKEIAKAIITTQEKERSIIGKELHDNVNQLLTTAKLYVQNIHYYPEQKDIFSEKSAEIIQKCITEIRSLSRALITPTLSDLGFKTTIDEMVAYYKELKSFSVELNYSLDENKMDADLKLSIYRILQELFNNTVKYAHAAKVDVVLQARNNYIRMIYLDDGLGFTPCSMGKGMGITNMKSRVAVHKGRMRLLSDKGKGCKALIIFPLG